ncbi:Os06g0355432 [Oryza sativa Japonica Group]|uniref:Uncharacterized protein n=2 Tax=Oryza sativa subsp. japonica TaxID=39947 RepID=A0A8J8XBD2_ORYSJ|nr:hypothetical protein OsJ_21290 [Oryza sativa Japonica Group]BAS97690.1 Os06g0355432 [Oryza sativa Japonica Group]
MPPSAPVVGGTRAVAAAEAVRVGTCLRSWRTRRGHRRHPRVQRQQHLVVLGASLGAFSFFTSPKQAVTTTGTNASGGCGLSLAFPDASEHGLHRHQRLLLLPFALTQQG